jgi:hypothetical protein
MASEKTSDEVTVRQKGPRSPALRQSGATMTRRPVGPAEAAFAVAAAPTRRRSAKIGTSRAGETQATEAVLRHSASPELLPEMAHQLWRANLSTAAADLMGRDHACSRDALYSINGCLPSWPVPPVPVPIFSRLSSYLYQAGVADRWPSLWPSD